MSINRSQSGQIGLPNAAFLAAQQGVSVATTSKEGPPPAPPEPTSPPTETASPVIPTANQVAVVNAASADMPANELEGSFSPQALKLIRDDFKIPITRSLRDQLLSADRKSDSPNGVIDLDDLDLNGDGEVTRKEVQVLSTYKLEDLASDGSYRLDPQFPPSLLPNQSISGSVLLHLNNGEKVASTGVLFDSYRLNDAQGKPIQGDNQTLQLGVGEQSQFGVYIYNNFGELAKKKSQESPSQTPYYVTVIENPAGNPPLSLDVQGSAFTNPRDEAYEQKLIRQLPKSLSPTEKEAAIKRILEQGTRANDAKLQGLTLHPEQNKINQKATIAPGKSIVLYTALPLTGQQDLRAQFQFKASFGEGAKSTDPNAPTPVIKPLHVQTAVVSQAPKGAGSGSGILTGEATQGLNPKTQFPGIMQKELTGFIEPTKDNKTHHLKQASDFSSPQALAVEMQSKQLNHLKGLIQDYDQLVAYLDGKGTTFPSRFIPGKLDSNQIDTYKKSLVTKAKQAGGAVKLLEPLISRQELEAYLKKGEDLARDLNPAILQHESIAQDSPQEAGPRIAVSGKQNTFSPAMMDRVRAWNIDMKTIQRVLDPKPDSKLDNDTDPLKLLGRSLSGQFWGTQFTLGRGNGVVQGQIIESKLDDQSFTLNQGESYREWNYVLNTHPLNTGGSQSDQSPAPAQAANTRSDAAPFIAQSNNVASPPPLAYGNYAAEYKVSGNFTNQTDKAQALDIRLGSQDEMGHMHYLSLFDQSDSFLNPSSTRFTGTAKITISPPGKPVQTLEVSVLHGRIQLPQSLLNKPMMVEPGASVKVQLDLPIPTNSTPALFLQFVAGSK